MMITARFYKKGPHYTGLEVSGHAFYDEHGRDIVCSAVSALATTGYNSLCHYLGEDRISLDLEESEGYLKFKIIDASENDLEKADIIIKTIEIGIDSIAQEYPEHVTVKEGGGWHAKN